MTHATRVLSQARQYAEDEGLPEDLRERFATRAEELEEADASHEGVPVNVIKEWRDGALVSVRYLDGERREEVEIVDPDELEPWDPEVDNTDGE